MGSLAGTRSMYYYYREGEKTRLAQFATAVQHTHDDISCCTQILAKIQIALLSDRVSGDGTSWRCGSSASSVDMVCMS
jgi:hypothetical protein